MDVLFSHCCGLDVHKRLVVACRITPGPEGLPLKERRSFGTFTDDLLRLSDWLAEANVTHVVMEATGVYWKPLYNLLEEHFTVWVVNAAHVNAVPGRKTDVKDAEWLADLLRHGLLRASFIPDRPQRQLRDLTRYRTTLVRERAAEVNRLQKTLEGANLKLASVVSDVMGKSGREILASLVQGESDPAKLAQLARGRLQEKVPELERALVGRFTAHERFVVSRQLAHLDSLEELIGQISQEIAARLSPRTDPEASPPHPSEPATPSPEEEGPGALGEGEEQKKAAAVMSAVERLATIPGVSRRTAEMMIAEVGTDMERFPTARHLAAWAGMAPGNHESGGKRKSGRTRKGSPWLRSGLVEAAKAAGRTKGTYLGAQYQRLKARRGSRRAAVAVGHTILVIAYHLLKRGTVYQDLGANYFEERDRSAIKQGAIRRLEALGYDVTVHEKLAA